MRASAREVKMAAPLKRPAAGAGPQGRAPTKAVGRALDGKKAKRARKVSRQDVGRQVAQELLKLRPILKEAGAALLDRLDGELAGLTLALDGQDVAGERPVLPRASVLCSMFADIKALKLKPRKGRVKDLRRIEALLESLSTRIPPAP